MLSRPDRPRTRQRIARRVLYAALALSAVLAVIAFRRSLSSPAARLAKRTLVEGHDGQHDNETASDALIDWLTLYQSARPGAPRAALFSLMVVWLVFLFAFVGICASEFFCPNLSHIASRLGLSESVAGVTFLAFSNGSPDVFSTFAALKSDSGSLAIGELIGAASFIVSVVAGTMALITPFRVARGTFLRDVGFFTIAVLLTLGILWDSHIHLWEALLMVGLYSTYVVVVGVGSWWSNRRERERARMREVRGEYDHDDEPLEGEIEWETEGAIALPSGASTPTSSRSRSYRSPSPAYSSNTIIYHPSVSEPTSPTLNRARSSSTASSLRSPLTPSARPPITPLISGGGGHQRRRSRSVRPSLLGAIEFRDVVNSLHSERGSAANVLAIFSGAHQHHAHSHELLEEVEEGAERDLLGGEEAAIGLGFGGGQEALGRRRALSQPAAPAALRLGGGDDVLANGVLREAEQKKRVPLGGRRTTWQPGSSDSEAESEDGAPRKMSGVIDLSHGVENPWHGARSSFELDQDRSPTIRRVPSILLTTDSGSDTILADGPPSPHGSTGAPSLPPSAHHRPRRRRHHLFRAFRRALFPSLQSFRSKSIVGCVTALLCAPALLVLNLTLPVVEEPSEEAAASWANEKLRPSSLLSELNGDADAEILDDPVERVGRQLHSPAIDAHRHTPSPRTTSHTHPSHGHDHSISHSHHLQHIRAAAAEAEAPSRAWEEVSTTPLESPSASRPDTPQQLEYFRIVNESEASEASRVPSTSVSGGSSVHGGKGGLENEEEEEVEELMEAKATDQVTRTLTAVQCAVGPLFCVCALFADALQWYYFLAAISVGLLFAFLAYRFFDDPRHPGRVSLCFLGFFIAMVWILMIVNEVVGVLLTIGHIFGISDAILGLTIFAMGNSLGDLVANATVARMGYPSMAIAACFGGPMLNILLGVGLSGTYLILFNSPPDEPGRPIHIQMGHTLLVSGVGLFAILLGSLVVVPLNKYRMSKRVGAVLIGAYTIVLCVNIAVEIFL
ncbi:hypothetical protein JCM8547_000382 [Rhodosporidiobolus lusitaniae]